MAGIKKLFEEKNIHLVFEISLWLKGVFALSEIVGGIAAFFVTKQGHLKSSSAITQSTSQTQPANAGCASFWSRVFIDLAL